MKSVVNSGLSHILLRLLVTVLSVTTAYHAAAVSSSKREMRGVWVATVWGIDWPSCQGTTTDVRKRQQKELADLLDRCKALNLTTVCLQVRSMADVMYRSELEPWSSFVSGSRGKDPGWDPLGWAVEECHRRGLECYAWVNPFRWSAGADYDTPHDRRCKERGWLLRHEKYTVLNPGQEDVRRHVVAVCREIVTGYDVDGLIFDDYFYPNRIPETEDAPDYALYRAEAPWMTFGDWRRANVHKAIADVRAMIADVRPDVRFGISPAGVAGKSDTSADKWGAESVNVKARDWQYDEIYSDPLGLMYQGTIDFVSPQIYWSTTHETAPYVPLAQWWSRTANLYGRHMYASVTLQHINEENLDVHRDDLLRQIECNRSMSVDGNQGTMIYSAKFLPKVCDVLTEGPWCYPALTPEVPGCEKELLGMAAGLRVRGSVLSWQPVEGARRYTVYAVPDDVTLRDAMDESGDGIDAAFLLGITYSPSMEVGTEPGYRYGVCVYSGHSSEGTPAWTE